MPAACGVGDQRRRARSRMAPFGVRFQLGAGRRFGAAPRCLGGLPRGRRVSEPDICAVQAGWPRRSLGQMTGVRRSGGDRGANVLASVEPSVSLMLGASTSQESLSSVLTGRPGSGFVTDSGRTCRTRRAHDEVDACGAFQ